MRSFREFETGSDDEGRRLDRLVRKFLPELGLAEIYRAIRTGGIRVDGGKAEPSTRIAAAARVAIDVRYLDGKPASVPSPEKPGPPEWKGPTPLVVLETADLLALSKPRGMLSHGPEGLDVFVRSRYARETVDSLAFQPAPLHRLDRNTSGLLVCSRTLAGARAFSEALREGRISKRYLAVVEGRQARPAQWSDELVRDGNSLVSRVASPLNAPGAKTARTSFMPLVESDGLVLAAFDIETGRTHQIRAQAAAHGHPLAGDRKYGSSREPEGYFLHSWRMSFAEPLLDLPAALTAPLPRQFSDFLDRHFETAWQDALEVARR